MKISKKICTAALAMTLAMGMSMTASAAEDNTINQDTAEGKGTTPVEYEVKTGYSVTIPSKITLNGTTPQTAEVSASKVIIDELKELQVAVKGEGLKDAFQVRVEDTEDSVLSYTVTDGTEPIQPNDIILTVASGAEGLTGSTNLTFTAPESSNIKYAGKYTGTVTFTVSVEYLPPV